MCPAQLFQQPGSWSKVHFHDSHAWVFQHFPKVNNCFLDCEKISCMDEASTEWTSTTKKARIKNRVDFSINCCENSGKELRKELADMHQVFALNYLKWTHFPTIDREVMWLMNSQLVTSHPGSSTNVFMSHVPRNHKLSTTGSSVQMSGKTCKVNFQLSLDAAGCKFFFQSFGHCLVINCNGAKPSSCSSSLSPGPGSFKVRPCDGSLSFCC